MLFSIDVLSSASRDHGCGSRILGQVTFRFREIGVFSDAQDLPGRSRSEALVLPAILAVSEVTFSASSTGVADLEAAPEVSNMKSL